MNKQIVFLSSALLVAACGGSSTTPAQDPSSPNTTSASMENSTASTSTPNTAPVVAAQSTSPAMPSTPSGRVSSDSTKSDSSRMDSNKNAPMPNNAPPAAAPTVAVNQNPGVADGTKAADNTKINDRDRHGALTPMDQGGSEGERNITASIRKAVVADKALSFTAKNVKIITVGTKVTLRGPVKSDQERSAIELRAKQTPGVTDVDNQLEVKK